MPCKVKILECGRPPLQINGWGTIIYRIFSFMIVSQWWISFILCTNLLEWINGRTTFSVFLHIQAKLGHQNLRTVKWIKWHRPPDTGFVILNTWASRTFVSKPLPKMFSMCIDLYQVECKSQVWEYAYILWTKCTPTERKTNTLWQTGKVANWWLALPSKFPCPMGTVTVLSCKAKRQ